MRWPAPIRARLPLCERRPGKPQFGRASDAQSGVESWHLGLALGILNSFRIFLAADPNFLKQTPHFCIRGKNTPRRGFAAVLFGQFVKVNPRFFQFHGESSVLNFGVLHSYLEVM